MMGHRHDLMRDCSSPAASPPHWGACSSTRSSFLFERAVLRDASRDWPLWDLTPRSALRLRRRAARRLTPLAGFMGRDDYESVCHSMARLGPAVARADRAGRDRCARGAARRRRDARPAGPGKGDARGAARQRGLGADRQAEAEAISGADAQLTRTHDWCVGGRLEGLQPPMHHDFAALRLTPADVRAEIQRRGWPAVIGFTPPTVMHRSHVDATLRAMRELDAGLLVHASAGPTPGGDVHHYARMRCYRAVMSRYQPGTALLTLSPAVSRPAGPRDALGQAIVQRNFGCTHLMAAPTGEDLAAAADQTAHCRRRCRGSPPPSPRSRARARRRAVPQAWCTPSIATGTRTGGRRPAGSAVRDLSAGELRRRLDRGRSIPSWFTFPEVADELRRTYRPRHQQGLTVFFTGLSGSGKSTLANALMVKLLETGGRPVTLLDGDLVRKHLSSELGFSKEHRSLNVRRIGFVASEVTRSGGIAICALIAPHDAIRRQVRRLIEPVGGFVLVHVATPLDVCEARDRKGLYAKARAGLLPAFTGISDPYEPPGDADLTVNTATQSSAAAAQAVFDHVKRRDTSRRNRSIRRRPATTDPRLADDLTAVGQSDESPAKPGHSSVSRSKSGHSSGA